jgi:RNA-directed DNA polymerase
MRTAKQENVIGKLAPMIIGWANYHRHVVSKEVYHKVDYKIWLALWRWAKRRHPNKGRKWISQRYFHQVKGVKRAFSCTTVDEFGNIRRVTLPTASATRIVRHPQIHPAANPFDPEWDAYFEKRQSYKMHHNSEGRAMIESLRKHQKGVCPQCGKPLPVKSQREYIHHLIGRLEGGKPTFDNLILLHEKCHAEGHKNGWKNMLPVEPHQVST